MVISYTKIMALVFLIGFLNTLSAQSGKHFAKHSHEKNFTPASAQIEAESNGENEIAIQEMIASESASIYLYNDLNGFCEIAMNGSTHSVPYGMSLWNYYNAPVRIATGNVERIRVLGTGNVGIGDIAPDERLVVSGGNIKVTGGSFIDDGMTLNVPDYVFQPEYNLMSFDQVEQFIDQNHHFGLSPETGC